ncbi:hypothetical protein QFZ99_006052 [Paraburkholderia atlantica]|uniref:hypothetical protein n=1 Tax=Paraburkholderia atlantica TaxID=2654982 RepID=UPI003D1F7BC5
MNQPTEHQLPMLFGGDHDSKRKPRFTTCYPRHHQPRTLADYERAFNSFLRDTERVRFDLGMRLDQLREQEQRARALVRVAPLQITFHEED